MVATVHRLSGSSSPLSRTVGVSLCPVLWPFCSPPYLLQLRGIVTRALHDVDSSVRRATSRVLMSVVGLARESSWLVLMCERAMTDPVGELRGLAVQLVVAICVNGIQAEGGRETELFENR